MITLLVCAYAVLVWCTRRNIMDGDRLLFVRFYLFRTPWFRIFLHQMHSHDVATWPHNHPWKWCASYILNGGYLEWHGDTWRFVGAGEWNHIAHDRYHRIDDLRPQTWTLFMAGRRTRSWGFLTPRGHVDHTEVGRV